MFLNRKLIKNVNWYIPIVTLLLIAIGILSICSAGELNKESATGIRLVKTADIGCFGYNSNCYYPVFDYRIFQYYSTIIYIATVAVLGMILIIGTTAKGRTGWISLVALISTF